MQPSRSHGSGCAAAPTELGAHGWDEYANWHLSADDEASEQTKARYKFPFGNFEKVHRSDVLSAEVRAGQNKYRDIEDAAIRLRDLMGERHD